MSLDHYKIGWGARIRTWECGDQNPVPYHLATPQSLLSLVSRPTIVLIHKGFVNHTGKKKSFIWNYNPSHMDTDRFNPHHILINTPDNNTIEHDAIYNKKHHFNTKNRLKTYKKHTKI
jgi:hypothetical protein